MRCALLAVALMLAVSMPAGAQTNLLLNPDFDTDLAHWYTFSSWSPEDWQGALDSGSVTHTNSVPSTSAFPVIRQCVELPEPAQEYTLSGWILNPADQSGSGHGKLTVLFYSAAGCDDAAVLDGFDAPSVGQSGVWEEAQVDVIPPDGTASAQITCWNQKLGEPGATQVYCDHLGFAANGPFFADGFESGDTSQWSDTLGGP